LAQKINYHFYSLPSPNNQLRKFIDGVQSLIDISRLTLS